MRPRWLKLGQVGKAHGLQGGFFVSGRNESIPMHYRELRVGKDPETAPTMKIRQSRLQGDRPLLVLEAVNRREQAESLQGEAIWVERQLVRIAEADEYFWADLEGRQVVDCDSKILGIIAAIVNHGATDIIQVKGELGCLDIPLVSAYVNMDFESSSVVTLVVSADLFQELWYGADRA